MKHLRNLYLGDLRKRFDIIPGVMPLPEKKINTFKYLVYRARNAADIVLIVVDESGMVPE